MSLASHGRKEPAQPHWQSSLSLGIFVVALAGSLLAILSFQFPIGRYDFREGDVSPYHIRSPIKTTYLSKLATRAEQERAAAAVADIYRYDASVARLQRAEAVQLVQEITAIRDWPGSQAEKSKAIAALPNTALDPRMADSLVALNHETWQSIATTVPDIVNEVMQRPLTEEQATQARQTLDSARLETLPLAQRAAAAALTAPLIQPNNGVDLQTTAKARDEARSGASPVVVRVEQGETILRDGDVVTALHLEKLEAVGLRNPAIDWHLILANGLLAGVLAVILAVYLARVPPATVGPLRRLVLVGLTIVITVLAAKLAIPGRELYAYLFPVGGVGMLLTTLLDAPTAIVTVVLLAPILGQVASESLQFIAVAVIGGIVGALGVWRLTRLYQYFLAGIWVSVASFVTILAFQLNLPVLDAQRIGIFAVVALANGLLSAALALGISVLLSSMLGVASPLTLLELAHPGHALFRRLLTEAPGTYHHAIMVSNLSERAAHAIGADALLARVAAFYHDVGKIANPKHYIENQASGENIHDSLTPLESVRAIVEHISQGIALGRRHGLPSRVLEVINQHHGTRTLKYFYHKAHQQADGEQIDEQLFRYPGPKPQSKEAAIVMLADAVEAVVRSSEERSSETIASLVERTIQAILEEDQLDECDLTFRDMEAIKQAFLEVMQGVYHPRIQYPTGPIGPAQPQSAIESG